MIARRPDIENGTVKSLPPQWVSAAQSHATENVLEKGPLAFKFSAGLRDLANISVVSSPSNISALTTQKSFHRFSENSKNVSCDLHGASFFMNASTVRRLLNAGHAVNGLGETGLMPLQLAFFNPDLAVMKYLIRRGAIVDALVLDTGRNMLNFSVLMGSPGVGKVLLDGGANVDVKAVGCGETALINASEIGCVEFVTLLLEYGADVSLKDSRGRTALSVAEENNNKEITKLLLQHSEKTTIEEPPTSLHSPFSGNAVRTFSASLMNKLSRSFDKFNFTESGNSNAAADRIGYP